MSDIVVIDGQNSVEIQDGSIVILSASDGTAQMHQVVDGEAGSEIRVVQSQSYEDLTDKPQINDVELTGNLSLEDLGIVIPTDVSDLNNDAGYITSAALPTKLSELDNDTGYITSAALPTNVSDLNNDAGYVDAAGAAAAAPVQSVNGQTGTVTVTVPTKVSDLSNDSGFVNSAGAAAAAPVQSVNGATGAVTVTVPTKVSELQNDSGFITDAGVTSFNGSTGAITYTAPVTSVNGQTGAVSLTIPTVPTNVSSFNNDAGYLTLTTLPIYNGGVS